MTRKHIAAWRKRLALAIYPDAGERTIVVNLTVPSRAADPQTVARIMQRHLGGQPRQD